jgi:ornithine--oxo-acid transaminase
MPFDIKQLLDENAGQSLSLIEKHINPSFAKVLRTISFDVNYVKGQGQYLWDEAGTKYLDCLSGFGVFGVGRNHPTVRRTLKDVMDLDLPNLPKFGPATLSGMLARELIELAPGDIDTVFFCNSGAEGCEAAVKYARAATGRNRIVYTRKGYHGLTMGVLSLNTGEWREPFGPLLADTTDIDFNDLPALERELSRKDVAAFIVEPIQGKGVNVAADGYLQGVSELCKKYGTIFIADEVQTGLGRTGKMFAVEHWNVEPDIIVVSKTLSGGHVPVGAVLSKRWIHNKVFSSMDKCMIHSTTFGQIDLAMAAGLATLHVLKEEKLVENAAAMGQRFIEGVQKAVGHTEMFRGVRGKGVMLAVEYGPPSSMTLKAGWHLLHKVDQGLFPQAILIPLLQDHHILAQVAGHHLDVIKFLPPLCINAQDVDWMVNAVKATTDACHKFPGPIWEVAKRLSAAAFGRKKEVVEV